LPRWVCLIDKDEVARLTNYGTLPRHAEHTHIAFSKAVEGVKNDMLRTLDAQEVRGYDLHGMCLVTTCDNNEYKWKGKLSAGYQVRQLVPDRG
jgi:hypothetical protein